MDTPRGRVLEFFYTAGNGAGTVLGIVSVLIFMPILLPCWVIGKLTQHFHKGE